MQTQDQDKRILDEMIQLYCQRKHQVGVQRRTHELCEQCASLRTYAFERIDRCKQDKTLLTCKSCPIHCYSKEHKEAIKEIMRFAGPRLLFTHPILVLKYLQGGRRVSQKHQH